MQLKSADIPYCAVRKELIRVAVPVLNVEEARLFAYWVCERYRIRLAKEKHLPKPWTQDPILQKYKFTNVRREQDKETIWLINHVCLNTNLSYGHTLLNCILFRLFNKSQTIEHIGLVDFDNIPYDSIRKKLDSARFVLFSNAFFTSGPKAAANKLFSNEPNKAVRIIRLVALHKAQDIIGRIMRSVTPREVFEALESCPGLGRFLAYQIFVDFTYIPAFPFSENEFVVAGPGCKKGLRYLFSNTDGLTDEELLFWLRDNQKRVLGDLTRILTDLPMNERTLSVMSLQNCMCEFSKYIRTTRGQGSPRIRYPGTAHA